MRARAGYTLVECLIAMTLAGSVLSTIALALHGVGRADRQTRDAVALELEVCRLAAQFRADAHRALTAKVEAGPLSLRESDKASSGPLSVRESDRVSSGPLSLRERVRVRGSSDQSDFRVARFVSASPHPGPLPEEEGDSSGNAKSPTLLSLALPGGRTIQYTLQPPGVQRVLRDAHTVLHRETYRLPASAAARWHIDTGGRSPVASLVLEPGPADTGRSPGLGPCRVDATVNLFPSHPRPSKP